MVTPRRARIESRGNHSVSTLELFFDLVFVFALTRVTDLMAEDTTGTTFLRGVLILCVMWWCWVGYLWLGNVTRPDEGVIRLGVYSAMAAVFLAAITIPESFDDFPGGLSGPVVFAFCYFVVRVVHLALYSRSAVTTRCCTASCCAGSPRSCWARRCCSRPRRPAGSCRPRCGWPPSSPTTSAPRCRAAAGGSRRPRTSASGTG
jgi:hypothetical protein